MSIFDGIVNFMENNKPFNNTFNFRELIGSGDSSTALEAYVIPIIELTFQKFINSEDHKKLFEFYEFYKAKIEELKYRSNIQYTLSIAKNRSSNDTIIAKVKWPYKIKGTHRKYGYVSVFIASTTKFPKGLKDSTLHSFAKEKVYAYINKNAPIELIDTSGNPYNI